MEPAKLVHANYLDIIFDNRNKSYGGYELRKHYNRRVGKAVSLLLFALGIAVSYSFITSHNAEQLRSRVVTITPKIIEVTHQKPMPKLPQPVHQAAPPKHIKTKIFTPPVIINNDLVKPQQQMIAAKDTAVPGPANTDGDANGISTVSAPNETGVIDQPSLLVSKPVNWVQQMPQFAGDIFAYIGEHFRYPENARRENITGHVLIRFVVNEDGWVSDATVVNGIGGGCDEEALRMVSSMPKWKPGKQNGIPVKVYFTLPINFVLD